MRQRWGPTAHCYGALFYDRRRHSTTKTAVFIDGSNYFFAQGKLGWHIDIEKLVSHFGLSGVAEPRNVYYYECHADGDSKKTRFFTALEKKLKYSVVSKPTKRVGTDAQGEGRYKGNMDVEITMDMLLKRSEYDHAILVSGDGDFDPLLEFLKREGKRVTVVSTDGIVSSELKEKYDYVDLAGLRTEIEKADSKGE